MQRSKPYPDTSLEISAPEGEAENTIISDLGGLSLMVGLSDERLSPQVCDFALKTIGNWPGAEGTMREHVAHVIVFSLGVSSSHATACAAASAVTLLAGAVAAALPVTAVLFHSSAVIVEPVEFQEKANALVCNGEMPADIWISVVPDIWEIERGDRDPMVFSLGLAPFVGREIELSSRDYSFEDLANRLVNASLYLITHGLIVRDGETMGCTLNEKIRVRYQAEGVRPGVPILAMAVEVPDP